MGVAIGTGAHMYLDRPSPTTSTASAKKSVGPVEQIQAVSQNIQNSAQQIATIPTLTKRMNVLLMGCDSNGRNTQRFTNTRSDTMILLSMDPESKKVGMVSIPRDSRVKLAGDHGVDKINAAHALGGPKLAVETVEENFNIPIDHYMIIDAQGLRKVFETLGPIEVVVEKRMHYNDWAGNLHVALEPGVHRLSPREAEEYVRFRHDQRGDIGRTERQQWFLRALANKLKEPYVILKLPEFFKLAHQYVQTDLSVEDMARIATFGKDIKSSQISTATLPGHATMIHGGSYWQPDFEGSAVVLNRLAGNPMSGDSDMNTLNVPSNSAYAATTPDAVTTGAETSCIIKYPRGAEKTARAYERILGAAGYKTKYVIRIDAGDCQHEQLIQNSYKADDMLTHKLQEAVPSFSSFPIVVNLDEHAPSDFVIVLTANTVAPAVPPLGKHADHTAVN